MVESVLVVDGGIIVEAEFAGHSGFARSGSDIVCAAVSAIIESYKIAVSTLDGCSVEQFDDGEVYRIRLECYEDRNIGILEGASRVVLCGLKSLGLLHCDYFKITIKELKHGSS